MKVTHKPAIGRDTKKAKGVNSWAKARTKRDKLPTGTKGKGPSRIERCLAEKNWKEARSFIQDELLFQPMDHWLWMTLGLTYHEEQEYEKAVQCSKRAVQLAPNCPLALWHYAGSMDMAGDGSFALPIWMMLLRMEIEEVAYGEHGEGMDWALQLLNDVHYRMGRYYQRIGKNELAKESFQKHLHNRAHGVGSIYDLHKVEQDLAQVSRAI
jgi:tetratricopeptide (TPR) repeat protein